MSNKKPVIFLTFANDKVDDALYLRNLPLELHNIREALQPAVKAGLCEVVERTAATVDQIFDIFQDPYYQDRIAVFHYGGHASGNQLMFETLDGGHGASHSEGLVPFFGKQKGLQLVFINGCSTQQQSLEMIEVGISAVVGTATAVKDEIATEISKRFYNGLASGLTIDQSWQMAIDTVKTKTGTKKTKGLKLRRDKSADFPWNMHIREGSEIVKDWNLPMAVNNPLFGLPKLPNKYNLPETPYRFLQRYKEEHAEVFFGRGRYIRDLYNRASDPNASPVILLYGQSGVGKSSMLDAGVLPRLQQENKVIYVRRDNTLGLIGTLRMALGLDPNIEATTAAPTTDAPSEEAIEEKLAPLTAILPSLDEDLKGEVESFIEKIVARRNIEEVFDVLPNRQDNSIIFQKWQALEAVEDQPLIILLDQVEEVFTKANPNFPNELDDFFAEISTIFSNPQFKTRGKLILSYRKEYHPEIDEVCKNHQIPREHIFLKQLSKADIKEVVLGLTSTTRLQKRYELDVEEGLPNLIADDLLEDKDSPIAPVLQILLTKMWNLSIANRGENDEHHFFTTANYQELKKEGILMDDFFYQQMEKLENMEPELVASGLALDVLNFHTTRLGTANSQTLDDIRHRYEHRQDVLDGLVNKLKNLYLLTDAGLGKTGLAHDTIAPLVQDTVRTSDYIGQRAFRILNNKVPTYEAFPDKTIIDTADLKLVEDGKDGMRLWTLKEEELIEKSRQRREARRRRALFLRALGIAALIAIVGLAGWANYQRGIADIQKKDAFDARQEALDSAKVAQEKRFEAQENLKFAKEQEDIAIKERILADKSAQEAEDNADEARKNAEEAKKNLGVANEKTLLAEENAKIAEENANRAKRNAKEARDNELEATKQRRIAENYAQDLEKRNAKLQIERDAVEATNQFNNGDLEKATNSALSAVDKWKKSVEIAPEDKDNQMSTVLYQVLNSINEEYSNILRDNVFFLHPKLAERPCLAFNKETRRMAFSTFYPRGFGQVYISEKEKEAKEDYQMLAISDELNGLEFSPNGKLLIGGTVNGKIHSWKYNPKKGETKDKYEKSDIFKGFEGEKDFDGIIQSLSIGNPTNLSSFYLAVSTPKQCRIFEVASSGQIVDTVMTKEIANYGCYFSKSGKYLTILTNDKSDTTGIYGNALVFEIRTKTSGNQDKWKPFYDNFIIPKLPHYAVFDDTENRLAVSYGRGKVRIKNIKTQRLIFDESLHTSPVKAMSFTSDNKLVTTSRDKTVKLSDLNYVKDNVEIKPINLIGHTKWVYDLAFSKDEKYVYTLSYDNSIRRWPVDSEALIESIKEKQKILEAQKAKETNSN